MTGVVHWHHIVHASYKLVFVIRYIFWLRVNNESLSKTKSNVHLFECGQPRNSSNFCYKWAVKSKYRVYLEYCIIFLYKRYALYSYIRPTSDSVTICIYYFTMLMYWQLLDPITRTIEWGEVAHFPVVILHLNTNECILRFSLYYSFPNMIVSYQIDKNYIGSIFCM